MLQSQKELSKPGILYEDNQSAICKTQFHGWCKHISIKYHFIRDEARKGTINIQYCRTDNMIADMLTKGPYAERFAKLREMAGLKELKQYDPK